MPDSPSPDAARPVRDAAARAADHASIDRLAGELLPALIAKLGATGLGELEVHEGDWRVRLRRPPDAATAGGRPGGKHDRRASDRDRSERGDRGADRASRGHHPGNPGAEAGARAERGRTIATSPAVGIYQPRADLPAGSRVRSGDRLGAVDMLGIPQEVVAPIDGVVGASLVEPGDAVEYGQELIRIEFAGGSPSASAGSPGASSDGTNGVGG